MGFFDMFFHPDISEGLQAFQQEPRGILLDVRTREEYREGHIPGSRNLPLDELSQARQVLPDQEVPHYVYCYSGARSRQAVAQLKRMGYQNVTNIGGMMSYRGQIEGGLGT